MTASNPKNAAEVLKLCKEKDVKVVDFKFVDMLGTWQHFSTPLA
jgi:glutamine synthetase